MSKGAVCGIDALAMTLATGRLTYGQLLQIEHCLPGFADDLAEVLGGLDSDTLRTRIAVGGVVDADVVAALRRFGGVR